MSGGAAPVPGGPATTAGSDGGLAVTAAAAVQRRLWGTDPRAWADLAEAHNQPLFEAVLDAAGVGRGTRVLDVGCGSGLALVLAAQRGAVPSGLDISPGLLGIARGRLPDADLREGDMEFLPFGGTAFDAVLGVNSFQFAGDPRRALREAARVVRPGGRVVASLFAEPERSEGTVVHEAMSALIPPGQAGDHAPYALSAPDNLEAALAGAGLHGPRRSRVQMALRVDDRRRRRPPLLRGRRPGQGSGRRAHGPRRPAARPRAVPGPADQRRHHGKHVPLGNGSPVTTRSARLPTALAGATAE
jgi:SAM-dependent methyltransferase